MVGLMVCLYCFISISAVADPCVDWFRSSKLKPSPRCDERCATLAIGMGTFSCPMRCKEFCASKPDNCSVLRSKLKNDRPKNWIPKYEKSKKWTPAETERVLGTLQALPEKLQSMLKALHRMDSSAFGDNSGKETEEGIVLYDSAFGDKYVLGRVVAHEISHTMFRKLSDTEKSSYFEAAQWRQESAKSRPRVGRPKETFLSDHGRDSVGEDFAINVEYYLFDPERLKKVTPRVYEWLKARYGDWLHLRDSDGASQCTVFTCYSQFHV